MAVVQIESNLVDLENRVFALRAELNSVSTDRSSDDSELTTLYEENLKLKYRLGILNMSLADANKHTTVNLDESSKSAGCNLKCVDKIEDRSVMTVLSCWFSNALRRTFPQLPDDTPIQLAVAGKPQFGDYQFNNAMAVSKFLTGLGTKISPRSVADAIVSNLEPPLDAFDLVEKLEIAGAGFVNIHLNRQHISQWIDLTVRNGVKPPRVDRRLTCVVDFSSPNIAKQMHVGHLRSTIIGEAICRLLEWLGHKTVRINHVGDWGTQFGMLISQLKDKCPNYKQEVPCVADLMVLYKQSKERFDNDKEFNVIAHEEVVKLQSGDPDSIALWKRICDVSRSDFNSLYDRLGVTITERGESFYQSRMVDVVNELKEKGVTTEEDGRLLLFVPGCSVPLVLVKSDGGFTYATSDMATIKQRLNEECGDWLIYVVDSGQSLHLETIFAAARYVGFYDPNKVRVVHMSFGVVLGENKKKLKTREGATIRLVDLLDEGLRRSESKLREKERHCVLSAAEFDAARKNVAYGCIKYADLAHNRITDYVFSFDRMLEDKGNTAVYLLYAYTRIRSIARNADITDRLSLVDELSKTGGVKLVHEKEWKLAKQLLKFRDVVLSVLDELYLHILCEYVYDLCSVFTEFYDKCYVIEKDANGKVKSIDFSRMSLCECTADIVKQCFNILGIDSCERM